MGPRIGCADRRVGGTQLSSCAQQPARAPVEFLRPNPRNPRQNFDEEGLQELAELIRERGIVQPILVARCPEWECL